jgi:hypothetical protein
MQPQNAKATPLTGRGPLIEQSNASNQRTTTTIMPAATLPANRTEYLLAEMRCAVLRTRILQADIEAIGVALKGGLISAAQAIENLHDVDALWLVGAPRAHEPRHRR